MLARMTATDLWHKKAARETTIMPSQQVLAITAIDVARVCLWKDKLGLLAMRKTVDLIIRQAFGGMVGRRWGR